MTGRVLAGPGATVRVSTPGKINLFLAVGDRRPDGYHDLVTVFHAVDLVDEVSLRPADRLTVRTHGTDGSDLPVPADAENLAGAAVTLLARRLGRDPDVAVEITKRIPVAGGMAGGSADAAAALLGCAAMWGQDVPRAQLAGWAAELGSDVPFALSGGTALGLGRGERLSPVLSRATLHWVLAPADGGLSTPAVFGELDRMRADAAAGARSLPRAGEVEPMLAALATGDLAGIAAAMVNDLQAAACSLRPELRRTLRAGLEAGALGGVVSGSGPTVALLCADPDHATRVATELAGSGAVRTVRTASGPVPGARVLGGRS